MSSLLEMDPTKRLTAYEAICHSYFDDIRQSDYFDFDKSIA